MSIDGSTLQRGWNRYGPGAVPTPGSSTPHAAPGSSTPREAWYVPARSLGNRSVLIAPGDKPQLVSGASSGRKFCAIFNLSLTTPVFIGDSDQVSYAVGPFAGFPLLAQSPMNFDQHEYAGDVYAALDPTAPGPVELRVLDPSGSL